MLFERVTQGLLIKRNKVRLSYS